VCGVCIGVCGVYMYWVCVCMRVTGPGYLQSLAQSTELCLGTLLWPCLSSLLLLGCGLLGLGCLTFQVAALCGLPPGLL
jgi:hypothetical protein